MPQTPGTAHRAAQERPRAICPGKSRAKPGRMPEAAWRTQPRASPPAADAKHSRRQKAAAAAAAMGAAGAAAAQALAWHGGNRNTARPEARRKAEGPDAQRGKKNRQHGQRKPAPRRSREPEEAMKAAEPMRAKRGTPAAPLTLQRWTPERGCKHKRAFASQRNADAPIPRDAGRGETGKARGGRKKRAGRPRTNNHRRQTEDGERFPRQRREMHTPAAEGEAGPMTRGERRAEEANKETRENTPRVGHNLRRRAAARRRNPLQRCIRVPAFIPNARPHHSRNAYKNGPLLHSHRFGKRRKPPLSWGFLFSSLYNFVYLRQTNII